MKIGTKAAPAPSTAPAPTPEEMALTLREQEARLARIVDEAAGIEDERRGLERAWSDALAAGDEKRADAAEEQLQQLQAKRRRLDATIPGLRSAIEQLRFRIEYAKIEKRQAICRQLSAESDARDRRRDELIRELADLSAAEYVASKDFERHREALMVLRADGPIGGLTRPGMRRLHGGGMSGTIVNPCFWHVGRLFYSDGEMAWPSDALIAEHTKA